MKEKHEELVRQADTLLRDATKDALAKTAVVLQMIADGTLEPSTAGMAAQDLTRLLDAVREAEAVGLALRGRLVRRSNRVH